MADLRASTHMHGMSTETQGSTETGQNKRLKSDKGRRSWSQREEEILRASLKELVALGWKSDNGFRVGYLNKLEEALRREFPDTNLRVHPHIVSKLTAWKKNYYSLQGILSRSGVGFNLRGDHTIDCDDEQWEHITRVDVNARLMRNKSWPYWEDWQVIFGKDRANGANAEDILEAVNNLSSGDNLRNLDRGVSLEDIVHNDPVEDNNAQDGAEDSVSQIAKESPLPKRSGRKRKSDDYMDAIFNLLGKMHEDTNARLDGLSTRIGYEVDLSNARKELFAILGRIPGLSLDEKFDVSEALVKQPERLDLFMGLPDSARPAYVIRILTEKRKEKR